ncbi:MAG: YtxH domain-containing protein [bacterium]
MKVRDMSREDLLKLVGLSSRRQSADYLLPALGMFGAGILVGVGLGMLFAPTTGHQLRQRFGRHLPPFREGPGEEDITHS